MCSKFRSLDTSLGKPVRSGTGELIASVAPRRNSEARMFSLLHDQSDLTLARFQEVTEELCLEMSEEDLGPH